MQNIISTAATPTHDSSTRFKRTTNHLVNKLLWNNPDLGDHYVILIPLQWRTWIDNGYNNNELFLTRYILSMTPYFPSRGSRECGKVTLRYQIGKITWKISFTITSFKNAICTGCKNSTSSLTSSTCSSASTIPKKTDLQVN